MDEDEEDALDESNMDIFNDVIGSLNLKNEAYHLSDVRDLINKKFLENGLGKIFLHYKILWTE